MTQSIGRATLLVDGLNLQTRHFVANPAMSDAGHHVGGVIGFMRAIQNLSQKLQPANIVVVWEGGGSPRRRAIFPEYKSRRKPQKLNRYYENDIPNTVENRNYQIRLLIELLRHTPINQVYVSDCEADDVIGYLARHKLKDAHCVIVSSDKDFYQLLSARVTQWSPGQKRFLTPEIVQDKFGIPPHNFCLARCLIGDPSDAINGVKGAGFKTLVKRFPSLVSLENLSVDDILQENEEYLKDSKLKLYQRIAESADIIKRNWHLMYLGTANLAAVQIEKIEGAIDTFIPRRDKMGFMRSLIREGLTSFDADRFFMSINSAGRD